VSVLATLEKLDQLDHKITGRPETDYVFESRKWRLRLAVVVLLTLVSLAIALASNVQVAGWLLVAFAIATGVKTVLARRAWRASAIQPQGRFFEV
jgi:ABC-type transport system involved in cytochrome bd biosynthesis fused ATPase/permease subunit